VVGASCGKTSLCLRLIRNEFITGDDPTIQTFYSYAESFYFRFCFCFCLGFRIVCLFLSGITLYFILLINRLEISKLDTINQKYPFTELMIMDTSGSDVYYELHQEVIPHLSKNTTEFYRNYSIYFVFNSFV
jgi:GTPase SAR1 family protein